MDTPRFRRTVRSFVGTCAILFLGALALSGREPPGNGRPLALVGGRILTQTDAGTVEGTVLIQGGTITAVGPNVVLPAAAERIDVTGATITPGLIDARSTLYLSGDAARESAADGGLNILDAVDPHGDDWQEVLHQGVTAVYVQPATTGLLGGRGAVLRVGSAGSVEELVIKADAAAQAALGIAATAAAPAPTINLPGRFGGGQPVLQPQTPAPTAAGGNALTRYAQYEQLKRTLEAIKPYDAEWKKYEDAQKKKTASKSSPPKRDTTKHFLMRVLRGEIPLRLEAHREDDVRNALRLADELKIHLVLDGIENPGAASAEIVNRRVPLVLGPFLELEEAPANRPEPAAAAPTGRRGRRQPQQARPTPAAVTRTEPHAERAKPQPTEENRWALGTFSTQPRGSRLLRAQAAAAVAQGSDPDRVLRAVTRDAAEILGVADQLGSVAKGKRADLVVFAGDPLDPSVPVRLVVSGGKVVYRSEVPVPSTQNSVLSTKAGLPSRLPKNYVVKTQRLMGEDGTLKPGQLVVADGKIGDSTSLGDLPVIDVGNAVVTPGLVAGPSDLGQGVAIDDPGEADAGQVRAADVFDPQHKAVRRLLEGGFTASVFAPGSVNVVAGGCAGVRLGADQPQLGDAGVKFVLTTTARNASRASAGADDPATTFFTGARNAPRYPASLAGQVEMLEQVLGGSAPATDLYLPRSIKQQLQADRRKALAPVLERAQVAFFEAHTRAEVDAALYLINRFKLRAVLIGPDELKPALPEIRRLGIAVVARPAQAGDYENRAHELAAAAAAGVPVAFFGSAVEERLTAALAINAGMPREAAWRGLTTGAARTAGLPDAVGRLMMGDAADFVIWDNSPLDLRSRPLSVVVNGKVVSSAP